jgi:hypothetical protein
METGCKAEGGAIQKLARKALPGKPYTLSYFSNKAINGQIYWNKFI